MLAEVNHIKDKKKEMLVNMLKETIVSGEWYNKYPHNKFKRVS